MKELEHLKKIIDDAFPDSDRIIGAIESAGVPVDETLHRLGYKITWAGLDVKIVLDRTDSPARTKSAEK